MRQFAKSVVKFVKAEDGPTAVEYAVMLALIIVVCIGGSPAWARGQFHVPERGRRPAGRKLIESARGGPPQLGGGPPLCAFITGEFLCAACQDHRQVREDRRRPYRGRVRGHARPHHRRLHRRRDHPRQQGRLAPSRASAPRSEPALELFKSPSSRFVPRIRNYHGY